MKSLIISLSVLSLTVISVMANADNGIRYDYLEFRYTLDAEIDGTIADDGDGIAFGGSIRINDMFYALGDYETLDYDNDIESTVLQLGAGAIFPQEKFDAVAELAFLDVELERGSADNSETGFRLSGGARGYVTPKIEARALLNYVDVEDDDTFITIGADYFYSDTLSFNLLKDLGGDSERLAVGVRYYFNR
jgi:hypothetical protein